MGTSFPLSQSSLFLCMFKGVTDFEKSLMKVNEIQSTILSENESSVQSKNVFCRFGTFLFIYFRKNSLPYFYMIFEYRIENFATNV